MSSFTDEELFGRCFVGDGKPEALGRGTAAIRGSSYLQGPIQMGNDSSFGSVEATVMMGPLNNSDIQTPDNTLYVKGNTTHKGDYIQTGDYTHKGDVNHIGDSVHTGCFVVNNKPGCNTEFNGNVNTSGWVHAVQEVTSSTSMSAPVFYGNLVGTASGNKAFDIQHPSKEGYRLRHICLEGPEIGVYFRGRIKNKTEIDLPSYWKDFVDIQSITVSITPIGSHQDVIIKRWDDKKVYLQSKGGIPIDCFYHIFAERIDGEKLIVEYEGKSPADYPGNNDQYSIAGYHYDNRS